MQRLGILAPALIPVACMIIAFVVYAARCAVGRPPQVEGLDKRKFIAENWGPYLTRYFLWILSPVERLVVAHRIHPNTVTLTSLALSAVAGIAIATNHMATAAWCYIFSGTLDVLDGRLARATGRSSRAGAFLDSVSDRWAELFVLGGFTWFLRDSAWVAAVMFAVAGSVMVSYTRARGEGLGLELSGGMMQRAERIALVSVGTLVTAWFGAASDTAGYGVHVIGVAMFLTGLSSCWTAVGRWVEGYRLLKARDGQERAAPGESPPVRRLRPEGRPAVKGL